MSHITTVTKKGGIKEAQRVEEYELLYEWACTYCGAREEWET